MVINKVIYINKLMILFKILNKWFLWSGMFYVNYLVIIL